jgi:hypothetical protein
MTNMNPLTSSPISEKRVSQLVMTGLVLILIGALVVPAPWRLPAATNDEMLHLKSWRNRYGTNDVFPIGRLKISKATNIPPAIKQIALRIYDSGPIGQRLFIVMQDCHPSLWPITAEIIASVTDSSLLAIRLVSTICFAITLFFVYQIGKSIHDHSVGLFAAVAWCLSHLAIEYAGTARMYAPAMAALAFFVYAFLNTDPLEDRGFRRLALIAILPISLEWFTWPTVYLALASAVFSRLRVTRTLPVTVKTLRSLVPFMLVSAVFLGYYLILAKFHPSASPEWSEGRGPHPAYEHFVDFFARVGLLSFLNVVYDRDVPIAIANGVINLIGFAAFIFSNRPSRFQVVAILGAVAGLLLPLAIRMLARHYMLALFLPLTTGVVGLGLLIPRRVRLPLAIGLALVGIGIASSQERFFGRDNPLYEYPRIARALREHLSSETLWIAFPYQLAMCVYRYEPLPEPIMATSRKELDAALYEMPAGRPFLILTHKWTADRVSRDHKLLIQRFEVLEEFLDRVTIVRVVKQPMLPPVSNQDSSQAESP